MNMVCYLQACVQKIKSCQKQPFSPKISKKFTKYNARISEILQGNHKKFPNSPENIEKLCGVLKANSSVCQEILVGVCSLEIEEMKVVSRNLLELLQHQEIAESVLNCEATVGKLLELYERPNNCNHVGEVLRVYCKSPQLVGCLLTMPALQRLAQLNLH